jgi:hypothetical protein
MKNVATRKGTDLGKGHDKGAGIVLSDGKNSMGKERWNAEKMPETRKEKQRTMGMMHRHRVRC